MSDKKEELKVPSHKFVTSVFNQAFNEFIGKYHNKKRVGLVLGETRDIDQYSYDRYYFVANSLVDMRSYLSKNEYLTKKEIVQNMKDLAKLYAESNEFYELKEKIDLYIFKLNSEYKLDVSMLFDSELKQILDEKTRILEEAKRKKEEEEQEREKIYKDMEEKRRRKEQEEQEKKEKERQFRENKKNRKREEKEKRKAEKKERKERELQEKEKRKKDKSEEIKQFNKPSNDTSPSETFSIANTEPLEPVYTPKSSNSKFFILGITLVIVLIIATFLIFNKEKTISNRSVDNISIVQEAIKSTPIPVNYSFSQYLTSNNKYENKNISIIGFLGSKSRLIGKTATTNDYYVVDDYGNKIMLSFVLLKNPNYESLFVKDEITSNLFNVSGTLRKDSLQDFKIYVLNISAAEREYIK